jgi:hypothetical protein
VTGHSTSLRCNRVVRKMPTVAHHNAVQVVPSMKNLCSMVSMCIEMSMPKSVRTHDPYVRVATKDNDVPVGNGRNVDIVRHWLVGLFNNNRLRRWGRRWIECCDHCIDLVWIYNELALIVGHTSCNER